jgi:hypothetical protein
LSENGLVVHLFAWALVMLMSAAEETRDPFFEQVPFAQWSAGGPQAQLKWSVKVLPPILSVHQRLLSRVQIQLDGAEAARRKGEGQLIFYFQIVDSTGRIYQDHTVYDLEKVEEGLKAQDLICTETAFVLPGDYAVSVAIYDTATKEHAIKKDKLHVLPLKVDPLPVSWRNLPPVEFEDPTEPPDRWFVPKERGRLNLPVTPHRPVQIELLANLTPSENGGRRYGVQDRTYSVLFPSLKVLAEMSSSGPPVTVNASLLDLSRRRVVFHQDDVHEFDWEKMKASLTNATSASIDVKSLEGRKRNAAFFVSEVAKRVASADDDQARAVIVLSGPMAFDSPQDLTEVDLKASPNTRVFYIRLQNPPAMRTGLLPGRRRRGMGGIGGPSAAPEGSLTPYPMPPDQLEPMLKALDPRLFDVVTAEQLRKAFATIMEEISKL